ncbi:nitrous oxide reductase family maturation protein NosD [Deinococcus ficus]|uniref:nitrous oxide reductase family maturation protein NosD n=1 Tax=Deinococcus ficus TaxID=317577 RepID=UPI0003B39AAF|nr:nitrous oxide reductase family maturation protein NosD [Deinococcus ficus]
MIRALSLGALLSLSLASAQVSELQRLVDRAAPGSTIRLEPRVYAGNTVIGKALTVVGQAGTVLQGDHTSNVVRITAPDVRLEGLTIQGSGQSRSSSEEQAGVRVMAPGATLKGLTLRDNYHGIHLNGEAGGATVENCTVTGVKVSTRGAQGNGITIIRSGNHRLLNNTITGTRDGMFFEYSSGDEIRGNHIRHTRYGLHYMYSNDNVFTGNHFSGNLGGAAIMHSERLTLERNEFSFNQGTRSFGLILQGSRNIHVRNNAFHLNQRGLYIEQTVGSRIEGNTFFRNGVGIELWSNSASQVFKENRFDRNTAAAVLVGGESNNQWYENGVGNHWNVPALDLDRNGVADAPMRYHSALGWLIEQNELAYLFISSPALALYEKTNQLFSHDLAVIADEYPLVGRAARPPLWLLPLGLLAVAGGLHARRKNP